MMRNDARPKVSSRMAGDEADMRYLQKHRHLCAVDRMLKAEE